MPNEKRKSYEIGADKQRNIQSKGGEFSYKLLKMCVDNGIEHKMTFTIKNLGVKSSIIYDNGKKRDFMDLSFRMKGMHLSKMMYDNVSKLVESGGYVPKEKNNSRLNFNTIMYDPYNISENYYKPVWSVDIDHCYWRTAYLLGIINERLYNKGMEKGQEWKTARNAAIGSLGAFYTERRYVDGKDMGVTVHNRAMNRVRCDIIDYVWKMACKIGEVVSDGFLMYLTDCFFITEDKLEEVCSLIESYGYTWKKEKIWFKISSKYLMTNTDKIIWVKEKNVGNDVIRDDMDKHYMFNRKKHTVPWKKQISGISQYLCE
jgi:hypothetical protein